MTAITEKWARTAAAGAELDRVVAGSGILTTEEMFQIPGKWALPTELPPYSNPLNNSGPPFSTSWSAAGPLLEAISPPWSLSPNEDGGFIMLPYRMTVLNIVGGNRYTWPRAEDPCLAIARACAVLVARGITREDLEDV